MTTVSSVQSNQTSSTSSTDTSSSVAGPNVDYQSFLKLLVAQMKNQDPTKPMDSTQFISQLATFSQVEQAVKGNTKLDQILQASTLSQADAIIGRTVTSADGTVSGTVAQVKLTTGGATAVLSNGKTIDVGAGMVIGAKS